MFERESIKKLSKMMPKSIPKSMTNRCQIYAHKNEAKMMERGAKMEPGMEPQIKQRREKLYSKTIHKLNA